MKLALSRLFDPAASLLRRAWSTLPHWQCCSSLAHSTDCQVAGQESARWPKGSHVVHHSVHHLSNHAHAGLIHDPSQSTTWILATLLWVWITRRGTNCTSLLHKPIIVLEKMFCLGTTQNSGQKIAELRSRCSVMSTEVETSEQHGQRCET